MALGCLTLAVGLVLAPKAQAAKPVNSTLTGQSIMVNLDAAGTYTIHENQTWKYDEDAAAALFTNAPDGNSAVVSNCSSHTAYSSPVRRGLNSSSNHRRDGSRSGKTSDADGPWKDSTSTAIIGP